MLEKPFENKIKKYFKAENIWYVKYWGGSYTQAGIPDLLCCVNGYFLALEVKSDKGKTTALQDRQIELIRKSGGYAAQIHPNDFEGLKIIINYLKGRICKSHTQELNASINVQENGNYTI